MLVSRATNELFTTTDLLWFASFHWYNGNVIGFSRRCTMHNFWFSNSPQDGQAAASLEQGALLSSLEGNYHLMLNCEKQKLLDLVAFKFCAVSCLCVTCCCKSSVCNSMCLRSASDLWYSYFLFVFPSFFVLLYLQAQLRKVSHSFFTLLFLFSLSYSPPPPLLPPPFCSTHIYCVEDKGDTGREWSRKASVNCVFVCM